MKNPLSDADVVCNIGQKKILLSDFYGVCIVVYTYIIKKRGTLYKNIIYRPFHKTLPRSRVFVKWISVRFHETDYIKLK